MCTFAIIITNSSWLHLPRALLFTVQYVHTRTVNLRCYLNYYRANFSTKYIFNCNFNITVLVISFLYFSMYRLKQCVLFLNQQFYFISGCKLYSVNKTSVCFEKYLTIELKSFVHCEFTS